MPKCWGGAGSLFLHRVCGNPRVMRPGDSRTREPPERVGETDDRAFGYSRVSIPLLLGVNAEHTEIACRRGRIADGKGLIVSGLQSHHRGIHIARMVGSQASCRPQRTGSGFSDARSLFDGRDIYTIPSPRAMRRARDEEKRRYHAVIRLEKSTRCSREAKAVPIGPGSNA
jgi:hypothetical protein